MARESGVGDVVDEYIAAAADLGLPVKPWPWSINGHPSPTTHTEICELMVGIRRRFGTRRRQIIRRTARATGIPRHALLLVPYRRFPVSTSGRLVT
jgi:hypothetical protein